jgi:hypothetical protein
MKPSVTSGQPNAKSASKGGKAESAFRLFCSGSADFRDERAAPALFAPDTRAGGVPQWRNAPNAALAGRASGFFRPCMGLSLSRVFCGKKGPAPLAPDRSPCAIIAVPGCTARPQYTLGIIVR